VPDFDIAAAWYVQTLHFRVTKSWIQGEMKIGFVSPTASGSAQFELLGGAGGTPRTASETLQDSFSVLGWHHVCLEVGNVDDYVAELKRRGVNVVIEPVDNPQAGRRLAFFSDPWGNLFKITHLIASCCSPETPS
jgi:glyoxylase I family protein